MKLIKPEYLIKPEPAVLAGTVERLYDEVFGPARFRKASYLFRESVEPCCSARSRSRRTAPAKASAAP